MRQMLLAALLLLLGGCGQESEADYVARQLDMDLPEPVSVISGDSHGAFHWDGLLHIELAFGQSDAGTVEEAVSPGLPQPVQALKSSAPASSSDRAFFFMADSSQRQ